MATEYGKRLRLARLHAKLTQNELSKKTGVGQSTISTAEREGAGSRETPKFAQACGVDVYWLANGDGSMLPDATASPSNRAASLADVLDGLAAYLVGVDESRREAVAALLASLARNPSDEQTLGAVKLMIEVKAFAQTRKMQA